MDSILRMIIWLKRKVKTRLVRRFGCEKSLPVQWNLHTAVNHFWYIVLIINAITIWGLDWFPTMCFNGTLPLQRLSVLIAEDDMLNAFNNDYAAGNPPCTVIVFSGIYIKRGLSQNTKSMWKKSYFSLQLVIFPALLPSVGFLFP